MRIERIIVTGDVFRTTNGDPNQRRNVRWLREELSLLHELTGLCPEVRYRRNAADDGQAIIAHWFGLLGHAPSLDAWAATYAQSAPPALVEAMRPDYEHALVIGFELSPLMRSILDAIGVPWIDVELSPIRFLEDLALRLRFSWPTHLAHPGLVSPQHVRDAAARMRAQRATETSAAALGGARIFLAQTRQDRTLIRDGAFFPDAEAVERVGQALDGRRLVLKPHPLAPDNPLLGTLRQRFGAATTDANIYTLLATAADVRFLTVSSSAAIEARHFGHAPEVFHGAAHTDPEAISSLWAHRCASFWRDALSSMVPVNAGAGFEPQAAEPDRLRRILGSWGMGPREAAPPSPPWAATVSRRSPFGVILLAPPWPRGGSANLFAAQAAAHARRGARVLVMLTPLDRSHRPGRTEFWTDAVAAMKFPGVDSVAYPRAEAGKLRSYCEWVLAGRDDSIAISARYAASGKLPPELAEFVASARIGLIHANHVYAVRLAQRLARLVQQAQGHRPRLILDTHDIQSDAFAGKGQKNPHSYRLDAHADLLKSELALCAQADILVHVTRADYDFFSYCLPDNRHALILPTLDPRGEAELTWRRGVHRRAGFDFIYVGKNHEANLESVRWLLREVLNFASPHARERIRIVGAVGDLVAAREPALFRRYEPLFVGAVPSIFDYYSAAKAVLAPATAGTGTSIKLIEALCAGKPILTTSLALRGLPRGEMPGTGIRVHDSAGDFADALAELSDGGAGDAGASSDNAALYDRLFANARYFAALDDVLDAMLEAEKRALQIARA